MAFCMTHDYRLWRKSRKKECDLLSKLNPAHGRAIAQAVSRRFPGTWDFVMDKSGPGAGLLRELRFPFPIYVPSCSPQSSSLSPEAGTKARSGRSAYSLIVQIKKKSSTWCSLVPEILHSLISGSEYFFCRFPMIFLMRKLSSNMNSTDSTRFRNSINFLRNPRMFKESGKKNFKLR
jgi:hypothetical protein